MNKKEVVWLIIRLLGVYSAYLALISLTSLFGSIYNYASLPTPVAPPRTANQPINTRPAVAPTVNSSEIDPSAIRPEVAAPVDRAKSEAFKLIFWNVLLTVLYGLAAWYLIRDGKYLFAILNREEKPTEEKEVPQVTSLNL